MKSLISSSPVQVRVLKGPRQVGKTSLLERLDTHKLILFDDHTLRLRASENPSLFLDHFPGPLILDEATLVPDLFPEIKRRVDQIKRDLRKVQPKSESQGQIDYWITGSNQTLLSKSIQESLTGRARFFSLNTLSIHELKELNLPRMFLRGGWPELHADLDINPVHYLNDLISTFIERDIVHAAGIEKKAAFTKTLQLLAGQVGELVNYSSIASSVGVEATTIQSWTLILEQNHLLKIVPPYMNTLNKRLIKTPKVYFEDIGLAVRFQGWVEFEPLFVSPSYGHLMENLVYSEISRFFINNILEPKIHFVRNKEKVEIDFLIELPNQKFIAMEVKSSARDYSTNQLKLLESLNLNIVAQWIVSPQPAQAFGSREVVSFSELFSRLTQWL